MVEEINYNKFNKDELSNLIGQRGVTLKDNATKEDMINALLDDDDANSKSIDPAKENVKTANEVSSPRTTLNPDQKKRAKEIQDELKEMGLDVVDGGQLKGMLDRLASMENLINATADKSRLQKFNDKNRKVIQHVVRILTYPLEGKDMRVLGWSKLVVDQVYKNESGAWVEKQLMEVILEGGKKMQITYVDFVKNTGSINATIKKRINDEESGNLILNVVDDEGKEWNIASTFVN